MNAEAHRTATNADVWSTGVTVNPLQLQNHRNQPNTLNRQRAQYTKMCDSCFLLANLAMIDPFSLISYAENRMRRKDVALLVPELGALDTLMGHDFVQNSMLEMEAHNRTVRRGMKMGLIKTCDWSKLLFSSVSEYVLHMQSAKLAHALRAICVFGDRMAPIIMSDLNATFWYICDVLVITRETWFGLCQHMLRIAAVINRTTALASAWPDRRELQLASARLSDVFRSPIFTPPDALLWDPTSVATLPRRRRLRATVAALLCQRRWTKDAAQKRRRLR